MKEDSFSFWWYQNWLAIDQLANSLLGGYADETLSSRSYRMWAKGKPIGKLMKVIDLLFFWQKIRPDAIGHCHHAYLNEKDRLGLPPEFRNHSG